MRWAQLSVHLEFAGWQLNGVMKLAGCSVWKREGHPMHFLALLNIRYAYLSKLAVQRAKHQLDLYLSGGVADEQRRHDQDPTHAHESCDAALVGLEAS
jgi:hypothetical protein